MGVGDQTIDRIRWQDPSLGYLLEVQREMSRTRPVRETVHAFVRLVRTVSPASWMVYVLPWPPERAGETRAYRVVSSAPLGESAVDEALAPREEPEQFPLLEGGCIADMIAGEDPKLARDLRVQPDDPLLGGQAGVLRSAVAAPIFVEGRIAAWFVGFAAEPDAFRDSNLAMAVVNSNMLVRSIARARTLAEVRRLNAVLEVQISAVAEAQRSLLPVAFPFDPQLDFAASYEPCAAAGGDYYDFMTYPDGRVGVMIADVAGHGPAAAVIMAVMRTTMGAYRVAGRAPDTIVADVNRVLRDIVHDGVFVTAYFLLIDPRTGFCEFACCGHNRPRWRSAAGGGVREVSGDSSPPLGVVDDLEMAGGDFTLGPGDAVVLYTDGITEAFDHANEMFGTGRLDAAIAAASSGEPDALVESIRGAVGRHTGSGPRTDDQTLLVVRWRGG